MKIPKNTPQWIYGKWALKRQYESQEREKTVQRKITLPEEADVALKLHADEIAKLLGGKVTQATAILDLLYRSKSFREQLPAARKTIKYKRGTMSERGDQPTD